MKIGLLTFHCALNYGAVLQAIALYNKLETINSDTELVNYRFPPVCSIVDHTRRRELIHIHNLLRYIVKGGTIYKKKKNFDLFISNNIKSVTKECNSNNELCELASGNRYDLLVCGSDQIWNPYITHFEAAYFLKFADRNTKKISYAASIGQDSIGEDGLKFISENIESIDSISVREESAVEILRSAGVTKKINVNLDPVFFLTKRQWHDKSIRVKIPQKLGNYIFVYRLTNNPIMDKVLEELTQKTGLKCIAISDRLGKTPFIEKKYSSVGPGEFLYMIENAEYVVTDSFHGIAFSLLFEKKLVAVSNLSRNTRIVNLLTKVEMLECLVDQNKEKLFVPDIDYSKKYKKCFEIIEKEVQKNDNYLKSEIYS